MRREPQTAVDPLSQAGLRFDRLNATCSPLETASNAHDSAADRLERLHDLRVVRAFEIQGISTGGRHLGELADCLRRVLFSSPGEPLGFGAVLARPTEGDAGDHHAGRIQHLRRAVSRHEARLEPRGRVLADRRGGLLREEGRTGTRALVGRYPASNQYLC